MDAETKKINLVYNDFIMTERKDLAAECGRLLIEKKKKIKRGMWLTYIKNELIFSKITAQRLMNRYRTRPDDERTGAAWIKL